MGRTIAYVRVSTDDQVDYSPDAQAKRCKELARLRDLEPVEVIADEGWSGKNLERPGMRRLLSLIEGGDVSSLIFWRWDRLSRDQGDIAGLVKVFSSFAVRVFSVNEGELDLASASGRMQVGVHGVFAQYYRDQLVENTKMGQRQALESGRWINRAPTGYSMVDKRLVPNEAAPLIVRVFELRAQGRGYQRIADEVGFTYSLVQHVCYNRVYLGEVQHNGEWMPGLHAPLVTPELFNAAHRANTRGRRHSRDILSGKVRCGLCGRIAGVAYNDRNQVLYRCRHRGQGCDTPGRSAQGLQRAARIGLRVIGQDERLQAAIRDQLAREEPAEASVERSRLGRLNGLKASQKKLLALYYADQIDGAQFVEANEDLVRQIDVVETERAEARFSRLSREEARIAFERLANFLAATDFDTLWEAATEDERRSLVNELIDEIRMDPDSVSLLVAGAPPIRISLREAGLREREDSGGNPVVSEAGLRVGPVGGFPLGLLAIVVLLVVGDYTLLEDRPERPTSPSGPPLP